MRRSIFTANKKRSSYGVNFISNAAILLVSFRVAAEESLKSKIIRKILGTKAKEQHHIVMVEQARWGRNSPHCLEIPGGLLDGENFDLNKSWNNPMMAKVLGVLKEFLEETGGSHADVPRINLDKIKSLGAPITIYPNISDAQHQFCTIIDVTAKEFVKISNALIGRTGGVAEEGESTVVRLVHLEAAYRQLMAQGNAPDAFTAICRFRDDFVLSTPTPKPSFCGSKLAA